MTWRKMQEVAVQPEHSKRSSPSSAGILGVPAAVIQAAPVCEPGWQWQFGLSDILAAAKHPAER